MFSKYQEFNRLARQAQSIIDSDIDWEDKFDLLFGSDAISSRITKLGLSPSYCDPDTSYEEDCRAYVSALMDQVPRYQKIINASRILWDDDFAQFARLLAEIKAAGLTYDQLQNLQASMDLDSQGIQSILDRAEEEFERLKESLGIPPK